MSVHALFQELVKLARAGGEVHTIEKPKNGMVPYAVVPEGYKVQDLSAMIWNGHADHPERKTGTVSVLDATSFVEYYQLFHDENSRVFANELENTVLAVLDYHAIGDNAPRWCQHRLQLTLRYSPEWTRWTEKNGQSFTQQMFAEFIEECSADIVDAATMREVARELIAKTDVDFGSAIRLSNGQVQFKYSETVRATVAGGQMEVPESFVIKVPIFVETEPQVISARLRYRINSGKLTFHYVLDRPALAARAAFREQRAAIQTGIGESRIINGTPAK